MNQINSHVRYFVLMCKCLAPVFLFSQILFADTLANKKQQDAAEDARMEERLKKADAWYANQARKHVDYEKVKGQYEDKKTLEYVKKYEQKSTFEKNRQKMTYKVNALKTANDKLENLISEKKAAKENLQEKSNFKGIVTGERTKAKKNLIKKRSQTNETKDEAADNYDRLEDHEEVFSQDAYIHSKQLATKKETYKRIVNRQNEAHDSKKVRKYTEKLEDAHQEEANFEHDLDTIQEGNLKQKTRFHKLVEQL